MGERSMSEPSLPMPALPIAIVPTPTGFGLRDGAGRLFWTCADLGEAEEALLRFATHAALCPQLPGRCRGFVGPALQHLHSTDHDAHRAFGRPEAQQP